MSKYPRLQRRQSGYYVRAKVPAPLIPFVGTKEIVRHLGTSNFKEAVQKLGLQSAMIDNRLAVARLQYETAKGKEINLTSEDALRLALTWFQEELEKDATEDYSLLIAGDEKRAEVLDNVEEEIAVLSDFREGSPVYASATAIANKALREKQLLPPLPTTAASMSFLRRREITPKPSGYGYELFRQYVARGMLEGAKRSKDRLTKEFNEASYDVMFDDVRYSPTAKRITVKELIDSFENAEERKRVSPKTRTATNAAFRIAKEALGEESNIFILTRSDFRRIQSLVKRLPKNAHQRFPTKTLSEIATIADGGGYELMSSKTATAQLRHISALFQYAIQEFGLAHNHAKGLTVSAEGRRGDIPRLPFSPSQLTSIFSAPLYLGCKDDGNGYSVAGTCRPRRGRFWVPVIALFTGMRMNEICQLRTRDVRVFGGVECIFDLPPSEWSI